MNHKNKLSDNASKEGKDKQHEERKEVGHIVHKENDAHKGKEEHVKVHTKTISLPLLLISVIVVFVIVVAVVFIFILHYSSAVPTAVSYTPLGSFSPSSLSSIIGGNWALMSNQTVNSTVINEYAIKAPGTFPPGTVFASFQEFVPSSKLQSNQSNVSIFTSVIFYLNSSSMASALLSKVPNIILSKYSNNTSDFNSSTIGGANAIYFNGIINITNTTKGPLSSIYISNGKDFIIDTIANANFTYKQAESLVADQLS